MDTNSLWDKLIQKLKQEIAPMFFDTWFSEVNFVKLDNNLLTISVPMEIYKKHISDNYENLIIEILYDITGNNYSIDYKTPDEIEENVSIVGNISKTNTDYETNLNPNYTFDNYVEGKANMYARRNAIQIAKSPGKLYNPFFIYGGSGLGKTHLMHAIGNYIASTTNQKVLYAPCNKFVNDFIEIYRNRQNNGSYDHISMIDDFKHKYHDVDVLIIDDIQYLEIASKIQQEFFNTFNELYNNNKQIIISSDRSPDDLKKLEVRLRTRFSCGLAVSILPPDFELRMNIIDSKIISYDMDADFPNDVKEYIASNFNSDIRSIEGAIKRVFTYAAIMNGSEITLELETEALKDHYVKTIVSKDKIDLVQQLVANAYNVSVDDLKSKKRSAKIGVPRQIAMYICRTYLDESFARIGNAFGGKDHTTVMHSVDKIKKEINKNSTLADQIQKLITQVK